jgi:monoterpene epsilon-lactone hydrolase
MTERGIHVVRAHLAKLPPPGTLGIAEQRDQYDRAERVFSLPADVAVERVAAPERPAEWLRAPGARGDAALVYLHGGGYAIGSPRSHRHLAAAIGIAAGLPVLLLDYRLAPEHPFPAAVDDAVAACRWLVAGGLPSGRIALAGDSAGGGLVVATLLGLRDGIQVRPAAGVCISPWTDLTCTAQSYESRAKSDPIVVRGMVQAMARAYLGNTDPRTPLASPVHGDLRGLPPLLIHVGSDEVLLDDALALDRRATAAGVEVTIEVWDHMVHVWHWFLPMLDEAQRAVDGIGAFLRQRLG